MSSSTDSSFWKEHASERAGWKRSTGRSAAPAESGAFRQAVSPKATDRPVAERPGRVVGSPFYLGKLAWFERLARWVAEVMKQLVYAQPDLAPARELAAAALEQMGFQAESATWRNAFLLGAREYRDGPPPPPPAGAGMAMLGALDNELLFDALAVRVHAGRAEGLAFTLAWHFTDRDELWLSTLSHGALSSLRIADPAVAAAADLRITTDRPTLDAILQQRLPPPQAVSEGRLQLQGQAALLPRFFGLLDRFSGSFAVVDAAPWPL